MKYIKKGTLLLTAIFIIALFSEITYAGRYSCKGNYAITGQTMEEVKKSLGEPLWIEQSEPQDQNEPLVKITKLIYTCQSRTHVLVFQNETLISIYQVAQNKNE